MLTTMILGAIVLLVARLGATLRPRRARVDMEGDVPTPGSVSAPDVPAPPDERQTAAH
jgi:hypothetical protein